MEAVLSSWLEEEDDDGGDEQQQQQQQAPPKKEGDDKAEEEEQEEEEEDELELFMRGVHAEVKASRSGGSRPPRMGEEEEQEEEEDGGRGRGKRGRGTAKEEGDSGGVDDDIDDGDYEDEESAGLGQGDDWEELDGSSQPRKRPKKATVIQPLPAVDHSAIEYEEVRFCMVEGVEDAGQARTSSSTAAATATATAGAVAAVADPELVHWEEVSARRRELQLMVEQEGGGQRWMRPVERFEDLVPPIQREVLDVLAKQGFVAPTPIQAQALPFALRGRDVQSVAPTGSGKTLAYLLPLLVHAMDQREVEAPGEFIGLVLAPTRELVEQVVRVAKKLCKPLNARVMAVVGGPGKWEMTKTLKKGVEIVVATPGRLIGLARAKAISFRRCTMVVLDEADKMLQMGFELQVRSILQQVRQRRQSLLFSATFKPATRQLAADVLRNPVHITVGRSGQANESVTQEVRVFSAPEEKWPWVLEHLVPEVRTARLKALIFVAQCGMADTLAARIAQSCETPTDQHESQQCVCDVIHGDKDQHERNQALRRFRKSDIAHFLVATDVAARGLDVPDVALVVNYDVPKDTDTYVHRIGRTSRLGGVSGRAITLLTPRDARFANDLLRNLERAHQPVPSALADLVGQHRAQQSPPVGRQQRHQQRHHNRHRQPRIQQERYRDGHYGPSRDGGSSGDSGQQAMTFGNTGGS